jgi:hypothetical protein
MQLDKAFPSKYLKAEDLGNTRPVVTIASVTMQSIGIGADAQDRLVLTFNERSFKPLILNKINSETIAEITGSRDTDDWPGHRIQLFVMKVEFSGKRVPGIRVMAPPATAPAVPAPDADDLGF